jgi:GNAT superfamily N-acetyltransferase
MTTRRAKPEDTPAIAALWMEMMGEHAERDPRFGISAEGEAAYREYVEGILGNPDVAVYVAESDGAPVGYTIALILENPSVFQMRKYGFIGEMIVTKDFRRSGLGRELWDRARRWFLRKGIGVAQLNVSVVNPSGKEFWESVGFRDFLEIKWLDLESES